MKKLGILTFHRPINYGAFLQAYSLSSRLIEDGFDAEVIDYIAPLEKRKIFINALWVLKHYGLKGFFRELKKISVFGKAQRHLIKSSKQLTTNNLNRLYQYIDSTYDILIIGSDAVFNWTQNGFPSAFLPDYDFKRCKIFSYAASVHGLRYRDAHSQSIEVINRIFRRFSLVGVRDFETEKFVNYYDESTQVVHCCDPTFFINIPKVLALAKNFKKRVYTKYSLDLNKDYIVVMLPDNDLCKAVCEKYKKDYTVVSLFNPSKFADYFLYDLNPFEWVAVLSCAKAVITSYFHGTLLSLKVGTPVVSVDYSGYHTPYESKLYDLYNRRLKLPKLYFLSTAPIYEIMDRFNETLEGAYNQQIAESIDREKNSGLSYLNYLK